VEDLRDPGQTDPRKPFENAVEVVEGLPRHLRLLIDERGVRRNPGKSCGGRCRAGQDRRDGFCPHPSDDAIGHADVTLRKRVVLRNLDEIVVLIAPILRDEQPS